MGFVLKMIGFVGGCPGAFLGSVSKNDEFRIKNEEFCIKNELFCISNEGLLQVADGNAVHQAQHSF